MSPPAPRPRRGTARPALVLLAAAAFLFALWSALWLFLANRAGGALDTWLAAEAARGRQWTCGDRQVGGYPLGLTLRCTKPTFRGEVAGRMTDGTAEAVTVALRVDRPRQLVVTPRGPLILRSEAEDFDLTASWAGLTVTVDDLGPRPSQGSLVADDLAVTLETAAEGDLNLRATRAALRASRQGAGPDVAFALSAAGVSFPTLDALPGFEAPADAEADGVLTRADLLAAPSRADLERWRLAGGSLDLARLTLAKGSLRGKASGRLGLDDAHRPAGTLETEVAGFEPIAKRFGIPVVGVQIGGLLTSLLGGRKAAPAEAGAVPLPLVLADGQLSVGPFRTGLRLQPLY